MSLTPPEPVSRKDFACLRCGACCRTEGIVRIRETEIEAAAQSLGTSVEDFTQRFTRLRPERDGLMLAEREEGTCAMLAADNTCRIHTAKPEQCKTFPWNWRNDDSAGICPALTPSKTPNPGRRHE